MKPDAHVQELDYKVLRHFTLGEAIRAETFFFRGGVKVRLSTAGNFSAVFQPYLGVLSSYFFEKNFQKSQPYFLGVLSRISSFEGGIKSP